MMFFTIVIHKAFYNSNQVGSWKEWREELRITLDPMEETHFRASFSPSSFLVILFKNQLQKKTMDSQSLFSLPSYKRYLWIIPETSRRNGKILSIVQWIWSARNKFMWYTIYCAGHVISRLQRVGNSREMLSSLIWFLIADMPASTETEGTQDDREN